MTGLRNITRSMKGVSNGRLFSALLQAIIILIYLQVISAELFHLHRDPGIGNRQQKINHNRVTSYDQCKKYLCKYGYLVCSCQTDLLRRRRQLDVLPSELEDTSPLEMIMPSEHDTTPQKDYQRRDQLTQTTCSEHDFVEALKRFQKIYQLTVNGVCDDATQDRMSERRCGQPDILDSEKNTAKPQIMESIDSAKLRPKRSLATLITQSSDLDRSIERRKQQLAEYKRSLKDDASVPSSGSRSKRSILNVTVNDDYGGLWNKNKITWRLMSEHYSHIISPSNQRSILKQAFRYWSEVSPMCFQEDSSSPMVDIEIGFLEGIHLSCYRQFDGYGGEIAHKFHRDVHFDKSEPYTTDLTTDSAISLLLVAVHELGHVIGLNHTAVSDSVMNAIYHRSIRGEFELSDHDRSSVKRAYGSCSGSFDTAFDFVRWKPTPTGEQKRVYNTYFFRTDHYWMYQNNHNRTRYGDPMVISPEWSGLPDNLDAFLHYFELKLTSNGPKLVDEYYFFKGDRYYLYDSNDDSVSENGLIRTKFPAGTLGEAIPSNLDSVFYDMRDKMTYFFKGEWVYKYQYKPDLTHSCCVDKQKIVDVFPPASPEDLSSPDGNSYARDIDCIYFSYYTKEVYIIKGNDVWLNVPFKLAPPARTNSMKYVGKWNDHWHFICDGECT